MRPMALSMRSDQDIKTVAAFVEKMPRQPQVPSIEGGSAERGKTLYGPCTACHGSNGEGNPATKGPPLAGASDWYLLSQLKKFKSGVRGTNPKDTQGAVMRPMALTLADEQAMKDVIAYIASLK